MRRFFEVSKGVREFAMWRTQPGMLPVRLRTDRDGPIQIAFAGQMNRIRNVHSAALRLLQVTRGSIVLHVFSADPFHFDLNLPSLPPERITIVHHGLVAAESIHNELNTLDAGLISLDVDFPLPAFPSKIFSYLESGIPVLFHGPAQCAVRDVLARTGVGLALDEFDGDPLDERILRLKEALPETRDVFMEMTELTWKRLDEVI